MIPFIKSIGKEKDLVGNIFRAIKEKLVQMILKDTSANARDAAVSLLMTFKQLIPDSQLVESAITALPKYRVSEINKRLEEADLVPRNDDGIQAVAAQTMMVPKQSAPLDA